MRWLLLPLQAVQPPAGEGESVRGTGRAGMYVPDSEWWELRDAPVSGADGL